MNCLMLSDKGSSAARKFVRRMSLALAFGASLSGCAVGPKYHRPTVNLQPFHNAPSIETRAAVLPAPPLDQWWTGFGEQERSVCHQETFTLRRPHSLNRPRV